MKKIILLAALLTMIAACNKESAPATTTSAPSAAPAAATPVNTVALKKTGTVIEPVVIRAKPGTDGARVKCTISGFTCAAEMDPYCQSGKTSAAPKDAGLNFSARTAEKVKVGKWENYWYKLNQDETGITCEGEAWVYGQFVKLN